MELGEQFDPIEDPGIQKIIFVFIIGGICLAAGNLTASVEISNYLFIAAISFWTGAIILAFSEGAKNGS